MKLINATQNNFGSVKDIVHFTINHDYPKYYPQGAVDFFIEHHSDENIKDAIGKKEVYLLTNENIFVGTASVKGNEICRLFVLPQYQGRGYGTYIMNDLEDLLFRSFDEITLDASMPAYTMYIHRGYIPISHEKILTGKGHYLCYHKMSYTREPSKHNAIDTLTKLDK